MNNFAVILDLNGTLLDTEVAFYNAYKDVLAKYDIPFSIENFTSHWSTKGKKLDDFLIEIEREDLLSIEEEMLSEKNRIFHNTLEDRAVLMQGAKDFLKLLKHNNIKIGLESSSTLDNIHKMLKHFHIDSFFDQISSGDMDIDEQKYGEKKKKSTRLKALADKLKFKYSQCIVIGDAEKDIKGAKEAGMIAIAIPNQYTSTNDFSLADKVVNSFDEVTIDVLASI